MSEPEPDRAGDAGGGKPPGADVGAASANEPHRRPRLRRALLSATALLGLGLLAWYSPRLWYLWIHESTDDAFVQADVVVPIVPQVSGRVARLQVRENQVVAAGQLLLEIEDRDYRARVEQAEAEVGRRQATLDQARIELERTRPLVRSHVATRAQLDLAEATVREAAAARDQARTAVRLAEIDLERTKIHAPVRGRVARKNVSLGQVVSPGEALLAIVDMSSVQVVANFKETQISDMRVGQPVELEVDAYPGHVWHGHVESFQPGTGSVFSLLPPENASGNFVKVVQRLPVRIAIDSDPDPDHPLYPGLSVTPYVDTRAPGAPQRAESHPGVLGSATP